MSKHHQWLARQLPQWVDKGIVSDSQAEALRELYPLRDAVNLGRLLLTGIGAVMIGLGVILLFAYNWAEIGKIGKLAIVFTALIAAHAFAMILRSRHAVYSESLFALGTMLMGAGIFLVGQIYHMDSHYPNAFLLWSVGALALAWALPSLTQAFMAIILIVSWHLFEVFDFRFANHSAFLLILIGLFPLIWRLRSPVLARFVSVGLFLTIGLSTSVINADLVVTTLLLIAVALIGLERIISDQAHDLEREIVREMAKPAWLVLLVVMYLMTFADLVPDLVLRELDDVSAVSYFIIALAASQAVFFLLLYRRRLTGMMILSELAIVLLLLPMFMEIPSARAIALPVSLGFNLILLSLSIWLMIDGARNANRQHMVWGSLLFALLAMARYTDLFDSLIARAVVFLLVGISLFAVSHIYQRNKSQVGA